MELLHKYGYSLIFCIMLLEQLGFPIPATPVLLLAGALAASGKLSLTLALIFSVAAALIGDYIWFQFGRKKGRKVLQLMCKISLSPESCVKKTEAKFSKHGLNSLLYAKFFPGLNTIAPPMAGLSKSGIWSFLWRDTAGAVFYAGSALLAGFIFDKRIYDIGLLIERFGRVLFWLFIAGFGFYALYKVVRLMIFHRLLFNERISAQELHDRLIAGENITIVDLRHDFHDATLPGALRIVPEELDNHLERLQKEEWIVMYCT